MFAVASTDARPDEEAPPGLVRAARVEGGYRLSGRKYFVTGAGMVDAYLTRAEGDAGSALNFAVAARETPGIASKPGGTGWGCGRVLPTT